MKWSERRKNVEKVPSSLLVPMPTVDVVVAVETVVVALTMAVAEGEIVPAAVATAVRAAVVDAFVDRLVTVADAVVEGTGPAVKTLF